jgi:hypothetical protein
VISQAVAPSGSRVQVTVHPCLGEEWRFRLALTCWKQGQVGAVFVVSADERLFPDTLLSTLLTRASSCR